MTDNSVSPQPWDRQPGESNSWYACFDRYRLLGPERSILCVYNELRSRRGRKPSKHANGYRSVQARKWRWRERAEAWDERERRLVQAARAREAGAAAQRHTQMAKVLQNTALRSL